MTAALAFALPPVDWHKMFVPSVSPLELVLRGSLMYLAILAAMRVFRRQAGSISTASEMSRALALTAPERAAIDGVAEPFAQFVAAMAG